MAPRVAVVGVGRHGSRIAAALVEDGFTLVGAADPSLAGRRLDEVIGTACGDLVIVPDAASLADAVDAQVAIVTAPVGLGGLREIAFALFDAGMNVLTIQPDAFDPPKEWGEEVDARARARGVSFLATGVQDVWWVHLPAVAAGSVRALRKVRVDDLVDVGELWAGLGGMIGLGRPAEEFPQIRDEVLLAKSPVLGGALRVLARRLHLTPGGSRHTVEPVVASRPMPWATGKTVVEPGQLAGYVETTELSTLEGVEFTGTIRTALLGPDEVAYDRVELHGDPVVRLVISPFPGDRVTDVVPIARVRDLIDAPAGLHTAATMPPASYRPRAGSSEQAE
ncbi:hypothetical protein ABZ725_37635 [Streptomyces sp. NPDC006872]|uniref:hypothetical protein n=1 Tax=Streptomyces sp. NPDC006872 TaxID=3155720 RepID=UPI0033C95255